MAILPKWKSKKESRNSVAAPIQAKSVDQATSNLSRLSSSSSTSTQQQQTQNPNSNEAQANGAAGSGVSVPNGVQGVPNGGPNSASYVSPTGNANVIPSALPNGNPSGNLNGVSNGVPNGVPNGVLNEVTNDALKNAANGNNTTAGPGAINGNRNGPSGGLNSTPAFNDASPGPGKPQFPPNHGPPNQHPKPPSQATQGHPRSVSGASSTNTNSLTSPPGSRNTSISNPPIQSPPNHGPQVNGPPQVQSPPMQQRTVPFTQHHNPNIPQYPWSQKSISNASPFPRYGHAANYIAARDGEVFVMGGLKGSNVFGDLWVIETDTLTGYLLDTEGCPSPRVGHASLTLGNAFIVFGGDTKIEESDILDDNLYLLNTTSLKWTVASPGGRRPSGRYGHTISTIGSVLYVFGGQLDDFFFDDLVCFDLTTLQSPTSHWNFIKPNSRSPPPRTNHTIITYMDKLYLFGGTDGKLWYSDTWVYDPVENMWTPLECAGFIPAPCEGHSATVVGDIMYVFGGRSAEGKDLGTLSALKIPARKWFSFQNMGPGPTPRSGHSMSAFAGNKILIMGGESPDLESNPDDFVNEHDSNNIVYVLDTGRISYPPDANEQPAVEKRSIDSNSRQAVPSTVNGGPPGVSTPVPVPVNAPTNGVSSPEDKSRQPAFPNGTVKKESSDANHFRSASVQSELTPGYGYERVNVGDPEKDENPSPTSEEDVDGLTKFSSGKTDTSTSIHEMVKSNGTESPFSVDTVRAESTTPIGEEKRNIEGSVENVGQFLEQLKASNSWYETELAAAREKGFIPTTNPPVDVLKLRRVSQRITMDTDKSLSERAILVEALSDLKEELHEVQQNVQHQAEQASAKIAEAEADRDDAFERTKLLEAQLMAAKNPGSSSSLAIPHSPNLDNSEIATLRSDNKEHLATIASLKAQIEEQNRTRAMLFGNPLTNPDDYNPAVEVEKIRSDNINLEQQLHTFSDKYILAQHESSRYKTQLEDLTTRYRTLEESTDIHIKSLGAASLALSAAQTKSSEYSNLLATRNNERASLQSEVTSLRGELESTKQQLSEAQQQLEEHKVLLSRSSEQGTTASTALSDGIDRIVTMWAASKVFKSAANKTRGKSKSRDIDAENLNGTSDQEQEEEDDPKVALLEKEIKDITQLYETHQKASSDATRELSTTLQQVSFLKQELVNTETSRSAINEQLQKAQEELSEVRTDLEKHQAQLHDNKRSLDSFAATAKQQTSESKDQMEDLRKQLEENEERYISLENEYDSSLQYVRNSDKALTKTRDELNKYKDLNAKQQTEIDQLRLRLADQEENDDADSVASSNTGGVRSRNDHRVGTPPAKYNTRQIDLQLRDLRAQIIILQEERDELRASTLEVKKKLITNTEDLKDAQAMIEQLETENDDLIKRVREAEQTAAKVSLSNNSEGSSSNSNIGRHSYMSSPVDPGQADRTLDSLSSELDQIRNERERISGILNS